MVVNPGKHSTLPAENMAACFCCIPLDIVMTKNKSHHSYPQRSDWALLIMVQSQTLQIIANCNSIHGCFLETNSCFCTRWKEIIAPLFIAKASKRGHCKLHFICGSCFEMTNPMINNLVCLHVLPPFRIRHTLW